MAPSKQPKTALLQVRLEQEVRINLDRYAEILDANPSYIVSEVLKLLYRRDKGFERRVHATGTEITPMDYRFQFRIREGPAVTLQHGSRSVVRTGTLVRSNWHTRLLAGSFIAPDTVLLETPTAQAFGAGERREEVEHAAS